MYDAFREIVKNEVYFEKLDELQQEAERRAEDAVLEELDGLRTGRLCMECRQDIEELRERIERD